MSVKPRDFYHTQDKLLLAWRYSSSRGPINNESFSAISLQLDEIARSLTSKDPAFQTYIDLVNQKLSMLEQALKHTYSEEAPVSELKNAQKHWVEVSLSSSGMGFFSETLAEDDSYIEIDLTLDSVGVDITMNANVLECRRSADSENPGYWIRTRFSKDQEQNVDHLIAHVTKRQIAKLERRAELHTDDEKNQSRG